MIGRFIENEIRNTIKAKRIIGVDEVGRGCLAGPVVVCGVIIPNDLNMPFFSLIKDSKQLSDNKRIELYEKITNCTKIQYAINILDNNIIDKINILNATLMGMKNVIESTGADYALIDGNKIPQDLKTPSQYVVKGDSKCLSIAMASIVAKVVRDRLMINYNIIYPEWCFDKHKGYGTNQHIEKIKNEKVWTCIHRKSFSPIKEMVDNY